MQKRGKEKDGKHILVIERYPGHIAKWKKQDAIMYIIICIPFVYERGIRLYIYVLDSAQRNTSRIT